MVTSLRLSYPPATAPRWGMINTDASGQGSLVYGKTSDHVLGLRAVLMGGDILDTQAVPVALAETLGNTPSTVGRIYNTVWSAARRSVT